MRTLYYVHDPMCSWCWGFAPVHDELIQNLPDDVTVKRVLGGLAPDSNEPMTEDMHDYLQNTWRRIEKTIPGTRFNFAFWTECQPRRSTYLACRAVIAARKQGVRHDQEMTRAIEHAYYLHARNPSDEGTLIDVAGEIGLDAVAFTVALRSVEVDRELMEEIAFTRGIGANGFPSLVLEENGSYKAVPVNYTDVQPMLACM